MLFFVQGKKDEGVTALMSAMFLVGHVLVKASTTVLVNWLMVPCPAS